MDADGDLTKVKVALRHPDHLDDTKTKTTLLDDGTAVDAVANDGQCSGSLGTDTATAQRLPLEIKATDATKNKTKSGVIVSISDPPPTPMVSALQATPAVLPTGSGLQVMTIPARVADPNGDSKRSQT